MCLHFIQSCIKSFSAIHFSSNITNYEANRSITTRRQKHKLQAPPAAFPPTTPLKSSSASTAPSPTTPPAGEKVVSTFPEEDTSKDHDERPLIGDLLKKHASKIQSVRKIIESDPLYKKGNNSTLYDDIWILRFLLSHKNSVKSASKAAVKTMHFRNEHKLNELGDIRHKMFSTRTRPTSDHFPLNIKFMSCCTDADALLLYLA